MTSMNINGQKYQVRSREVDGRKEQIYYRDGEAFMKNGDGKLEKLIKCTDGIFEKATYRTQAYMDAYSEGGTKAARETTADRWNNTATGGVTNSYNEDYSTLTHSNDLVGYKCAALTEKGKEIIGEIYRDKETDTNKLKQSAELSNGMSAEKIYVFNGDKTCFLEKHTVTMPDGSATVKQYNYEKDCYEIVRTPASTEETTE